MSPLFGLTKQGQSFGLITYDAVFLRVVTLSA